MNTGIVEVETVLRLVASEPVAVTARFRYEPTDPFAVSATFHTPPEPETVTWRFAREVLATGLDQPAGLGDVRIRPSPWATAGGDQITITLSSPDCHVELQAPRKVLHRFLRRTYHLVPPGQETHHQDIDTPLSHLLGRQ